MKLFRFLYKSMDKKATKLKVKEEIGNTSKYFSPKKTRNKIKIEYEQDKPVTSKFFPKTEDLSSESTTIKKEVSDVKKEKRSLPKIESETESKQTKWEPQNWKQVLKNITKMREKRSAPVDSLGAGKCYDETTDEKTQRFQILVSLMLSSQTKDEATFACMQRLKDHGLTPENIYKTEISSLEKLIHPISFYKNKSKFIHQTSGILIEKYKSDIPNTITELVKLPGVGPKMAHITMKIAWNIVSGIGVDVHAHRIANRLGWVQKPTKDAEKTRISLEEWVPFELWDEINILLVGFGQTVCTSQKPDCKNCLNNKLCPSSNVKK